MITVVCFKWKYSGGQKLPSSDLVTYGSAHVNTLFDMVARWYKKPFRFVCITDDNAGLYPEIETIKLWDICKSLGGCFNRLFVFSDVMRKYLGDRFICIDLDCVITGDLTPIFERKEDFVIADYPYTYATKQKYNGSMFMMDAGCRSVVSDRFKGASSVDELRPFRESRELVGTDQAWIRHVLGENEAIFSAKDGVYDYQSIKGELPDNARIVFFSGRKDPSRLRHIEWINKHYQQREPLKPVTIACVLKTGQHQTKSGITEYTPEVVKWLRRQCDRFITVPFKFVCLTDLDSINGVETIKLKDNFPNWWSKIELFRPDIFRGEKVFYMDLDTVLVDNIDHILTYDHGFTVLRQMSTLDTESHLIGSGMMAWKRDLSYLYETFKKDPAKFMDDKDQTFDNWGDQGFIQRHMKGTVERFQKVFGEKEIVSFIRNLHKGDPQEGNKIIVFHSKPKPHEIERPWIMK